MTTIRNALGFTLALAMVSAPVFAATKPATATKTAAVKTTTVTKTTTAKPAAPMHVVAAKPVAKPAPVHVAAKSTGRMVTTKTSTGKTVTYNCSLAGNATKTACKG